MPLTAKSEVISRALSEGPQCLIEYHMGRPSARAVIGCGQNRDNASMLGMFDLSTEPETIFALEDEDLARAMKGSGRAIRVIQANRMPALCDLSLVPDIETATDVPTETIEHRARLVSANTGFQQRVSRMLADYYPLFEPSRIVEQRIYEGFPSRADEECMRKFHQVSWAERTQLAEVVEDDRLRELARRLVFLEEPSALAPSVRSQFEAWLHNRRNGREGVAAGRTLNAALEEAERLAADTPAANADALETIRQWLLAMRS